jgi:transcriptional regulator with XRE-family HTH domain
MSYYDAAIKERSDVLRKFQAEAIAIDLRSDADFQRIFQQAQVLLEMSDQQIADDIGVSRPSINRYANGKNLPYYAMRRNILHWIENELEKKIRKLDVSVRQAATTYSASGYGGLQTERLAAKSR